MNHNRGDRRAESDFPGPDDDDDNLIEYNSDQEGGDDLVETSPSSPNWAHVTSLRTNDRGPSRTDLRISQDVVERVGKTFSSDAANHVYWEGMRSLRTELLLRQQQQPPSGHNSDMIAVISPGPREGRSMLAADLAMSYAQIGVRTLLVDADMRAPRQHSLFGASREPGLTDAVINGEAPVLHAVRGHHSLYVCTAGSPTEDPLDILSSPQFRQLQEFWVDAFQVVVIDTPASIHFPDPMVVAAFEACRLLLVTRAQKTPQSDIRTLMKRFQALPARFAGAVVNHF